MNAKWFTLGCVALVLVGCAGRANEGEALHVEARGPSLQNVQRLTYEGDNGEAYFSADGTRLIFQSSRGGADCDKIWTMKADGSDARRIGPTRGAQTCGFFFPGGDRVVFASTSHLAGDCPARPEVAGERYVWPLHAYDIFSAAFDGSDLRRLTDNPGYDAEPVVSPDGNSIVFGSQRDGDFDVYVMHTNGSGLRRLTDRVGYDGGPWFSPDGTKIVWRAWHPESAEDVARWRTCMAGNYILPFPLDLWVMNADGSDKRRLTDNGATNWAPSWHPDGRRIVFSSNMDDWREEHRAFGHNFELYVINIDNGRIERVTFNEVFDSFPMFSPDAKKLVFASNRDADNPRQTDIFIADWVESAR